MTKGADKVGVVGEAGHLAGLLDAYTFLKKLTGPQNPAVDNVLHYGEAGGRFEDAAQIVLADIELVGDLVQGQRLGEIIADIVQNRSDPEEILVAHCVAGGGRGENRGGPQEQIQKCNGLVDIAAEAAVVFVALQSLKELDDLNHLFAGHGSAKKAVPGQLHKVGLGGRQVGESLAADVEHIAGVKAGGNGAVEGIFTN